MDAYTPFPIEELDEALGLKKNPLPLMVLLGGIFGGMGGYRLEVLDAGDRVADEHRRPAVQQLAAFHSGHVRVHRARRSR